MEYEMIKKLINNIIKNEFNHISENNEQYFTNNCLDQIELSKETNDSLERLKEVISKEHMNLLDDFYTSTLNEWVNLCRFYFKEGVAAGITNLEFIKDINAQTVLQDNRYIF